MPELRFACDICRRPNTCERSDSACEICKGVLGRCGVVEPLQAGTAKSTLTACTEALRRTNALNDAALDDTNVDALQLFARIRQCGPISTRPVRVPITHATEPPCTCGIGSGLHNDRCPVFIWGHANKIGFGHPARGAGRVPPQAETELPPSHEIRIEDVTFDHPIDARTRYSTASTANYATEPLVNPERRVAIQSFRNALERICEAYGVKLKGDTDASGDILIFDLAQTLPHGYEWSAYIEPNGTLEFCNYVFEDESGATKQ